MLFYVKSYFARESKEIARFVAWIDAKTLRKYCVNRSYKTVCSRKHIKYFPTAYFYRIILCQYILFCFYNRIIFCSSSIWIWWCINHFSLTHKPDVVSCNYCINYVMIKVCLEKLLHYLITTKGKYLSAYV